MQDSFIAQEDGSYTGHICTRREPQRVEFSAWSYRGNALLAYLWSALPGHFLPDPGASVDQKEKREERSAQEDASVNAEVVGAHGGAGAERRSHGRSAVTGTLPALHMTVAWPIKEGEGDGTLRILRRGAGTRRVDLVHQTRPLGATTIDPVTSGPPSKSDNTARGSGGVPRRGSNARRGPG